MLKTHQRLAEKLHFPCERLRQSKILRSAVLLISYDVITKLAGDFSADFSIYYCDVTGHKFGIF